MLESTIQAHILLALGRRSDLGKFARRNRGRAMDEKGQMVKFGDFDGAADITGALRGSGRRVELEVKRPGQRPTEQQARFGAMMLALGVVWAIVHSPEEAIAILEAAREEGPAR